MCAFFVTRTCFSLDEVGVSVGIKKVRQGRGGATQRFAGRGTITMYFLRNGRTNCTLGVSIVGGRILVYSIELERRELYRVAQCQGTIVNVFCKCTEKVRVLTRGDASGARRLTISQNRGLILIVSCGLRKCLKVQG